LAKTLRKRLFNFTVDNVFGEVVAACAQPRKEDTGTWITEGIFKAYTELHLASYAHSAEAWCDGELVGGLYGIAIGQVFFGESMFHTKTDASKIAFVHLVDCLKRWGYKVVDCQVSTRHLMSLGAEEIARPDFVKLLDLYCDEPPNPMAWQNQ
jgi:leucyl/phenylalanyl-tRNA--protein transferase